MSKAIFHAHPWRFFPEKVFSVLLVLCISFSFPIFAKFTVKLDQTEVPPPMDTEMKCGACPCSNPCTQQVTPPQPPAPPPPPPPPPPPKATSTQNCSPPAALTQTPVPPPPRFIYVTGVPGESSQSDSNNYNWIYYYSGSMAKRPVDFLALALWGSVSVILMIEFL